MRAAVLVSSPIAPDLRERVRNGLMPQQDFFAVADALGAQIIAPAKESWGKAGKVSRANHLRRVAWEAFRRRKEYDLLVTDLDHTGLLLAMLFKAARAKTRHVLICHGGISRSHPARLVKQLKLHTHIHRFVCYGPYVAERLVREVGIPAEQVVTMRHPADHLFWRPMPVQPEPMITSAGMLRRDYPTLVEAVRGLDVRVEAAAFSPWVDPRQQPPNIPLPDNVRFNRYPPAELRDLYARALFVAVPLIENTSQAGSLVVYEAMAMGKAVVVTRTTGEKKLGLIQEGETGFYVPPGDVQAWRNIIAYFREKPEEAARMGQRARAVVEKGLNMQQYVRDMVAVAQSIA